MKNWVAFFVSSWSGKLKKSKLQNQVIKSKGCAREIYKEDWCRKFAQNRNVKKTLQNSKNMLSSEYWRNLEYAILLKTDSVSEVLLRDL